MEIDLELYKAFCKFEKHNKRELNFFDRYVEHSELTEETLIKRAAFPPKNIEEQICDGCNLTTKYPFIKHIPIVTVMSDSHVTSQEHLEIHQNVLDSYIALCYHMFRRISK